jgi:hypothetical protein
VGFDLGVYGRGKIIFNVDCPLEFFQGGRPDPAYPFQILRGGVRATGDNSLGEGWADPGQGGQLVALRCIDIQGGVGFFHLFSRGLHVKNWQVAFFSL